MKFIIRWFLFIQLFTTGLSAKDLLSLEKEVEISIVCAGRNDDYGGNFLDRLEYFLRSVDRFNIPIEIVLVEWNPIPNQPKLSDIIKKWNDRLNYKHPIIVLEVSKDDHLNFCDYYQQANTKYSFQEYPAKNVGIRRSKGKYILQTNPDNFYPLRTIAVIERLVLKGFNDIITAQPVRVDLPVVSSFDSLRNLGNASDLNEKLEILDNYCRPKTYGSIYALGDFMLFKRDMAVESRGFFEYPLAIHHFEQTFVEAFCKSHPSSKLKRLKGISAFHFDHSRHLGGGLDPLAGASFIKQSVDKDLSLGPPVPTPKNDENWGLARVLIHRNQINARL